jgi:hypothetical protein
MPALQGIFIPTHLIYHPHLSPAILVAWVRLNCLAQDGRIAAALSIQQLVQFTGKSQVTILRHLSQLKSISALDWRSTEDGKIIISFHDGLSDIPEPSVGFPGITDSTAVNTNNQDLSPVAHYFPPRILGYLSYHADQVR